MIMVHYYCEYRRNIEWIYNEYIMNIMSHIQQFSRKGGELLPGVRVSRRSQPFKDQL